MEDNGWENVLKLGPECRERYINLHNTPELAELNIQSSGISNLKGEYQVGRTNMQCHTLIYSVDGKGYIRTVDGDFVVEKSTLVVLPAGMPFLIELNSEHWTTAWFELQDYPQWRVVCENMPLLSFSNDASAIYHLLALIDHESSQTRRKSAMTLLANYLAEISIVACDDQPKTLNENQVKNQNVSTVNNLYAKPPISELNRLNNLFKDVDKQLHYPWTVEDMSKLVHYSAPHFHRVCKRHYSRSPIQQLIYLRIQRAKYLLRHTHWTIAQIAGHVGYQDIYNFSKRFSKSVGLPPARFRADNRV